MSRKTRHWMSTKYHEHSPSSCRSCKFFLNDINLCVLVICIQALGLIKFSSIAPFWNLTFAKNFSELLQRHRRIPWNFSHGPRCLSSNAAWPGAAAGPPETWLPRGQRYLVLPAATVRLISFASRSEAVSLWTTTAKTVHRSDVKMNAVVAPMVPGER